MGLQGEVECFTGFTCANTGGVAWKWPLSYNGYQHFLRDAVTTSQNLKDSAIIYIMVSVVNFYAMRATGKPSFPRSKECSANPLQHDLKPCFQTPWWASKDDQFKCHIYYTILTYCIFFFLGNKLSFNFSAAKLSNRFLSKKGSQFI